GSNKIDVQGGSTVYSGDVPSLTVPNSLQAEATSPAGAPVSFSVSAIDPTEGPLAVSCLADVSSGGTIPVSSGSIFALGITHVTCSATDSSQNTVTDAFNVTVVDTTSPTITAPSLVIAEATGPAGAVVNFVATASDVVDDSFAATCTPPSGSVFPF